MSYKLRNMFPYKLASLTALAALLVSQMDLSTASANELELATRLAERASTIELVLGVGSSALALKLETATLRMIEALRNAHFMKMQQQVLSRAEELNRIRISQSLYKQILVSLDGDPLILKSGVSPSEVPALGLEFILGENATKTAQEVAERFFARRMVMKVYSRNGAVFRSERMLEEDMIKLAKALESRGIPANFHSPYQSPSPSGFLSAYVHDNSGIINAFREFENARAKIEGVIEASAPTRLSAEDRDALERGAKALRDRLNAIENRLKTGYLP